MLWLHRLQQRLSLTRYEALTFIVLFSFLILGLAVRHVQQQARPVPPGAYEEADRLFFERAAALRGDPMPGSRDGSPDETTAYGEGPDASHADPETAEGDVVPAVASPAPTGAATAPTGGATAPAGGATAPTGGATAPTGGATAPTGGATAPTGGATAPGGSSSLRIDLNRASEAELQQLPRVGPVTARNIVEFREIYGPFSRVEDVIEVRGIGPRTLEQITPFLYVSPRNPPPND